MRNSLLTLATLTVTAFAQVTPPPAAPTLPKVVLLGDSIREGYAPIVAELLAGKATVVTPKANGRDTGTLLQNLREWALLEKPQVIHFNCGIHDTKRNKETGKYNVPPEQYEANLRELVQRMRAQTKAKILFALSTPLIDERSQEAWKTRSYRLEHASVMEYNRIALRVMKELNVPVNDLPAVLGDAAESARLHDAGGIHFTKEGSEKLARAVTAYVTNYLAGNSPPAAPSAAAPPAKPQAAPVVKTESFTRDPQWEGHLNHIVPKVYPTIAQDFGYSRTSFAGKAAGEIGGQVHRASQPAYYAAKIPSKTLHDKLSASGTFALTKSSANAGIFFGWFNEKQVPGTGRPMNSLGMSMDCEQTGARLQLYAITAQNQVAGTFITRYEKYRTAEDRRVKRPSPIKPDGTLYTWTLTYDPAAAGGKGQLQFMVKSNSAEPGDFEGKVVTADLPAGHKEQGTSFDHFGLMNLTRAGAPVTIYFGDLALDGRPLDLTKDLGWAGSGNRTTYTAKEVGAAQDFGFRTTSRAGGKAGELGGIVWRGPYAYYADRVGRFTLDDLLEARGRLFFEGAGLDAGVNIGWFNSAVKEVDDKNPTQAGNFAGVNIGGHTRVGHWFLPYCLTAKGERQFNDKGPLPLLKAGTAYEWSFLYDPAANAGHGQMKVTLGGESATLDLKPSAKEQGATLDRFGIVSGGTGGGEVKFSLDDLQYSAGQR